MTYAAIRIRGIVNVDPDIKKTLNFLNLTRVNHCVLIPEDKSTKGMLQIAKDYITWGEVEKTTLTKLINTRGRLEGGKEITAEFLKSATSFTTVEKLTDAIISDKLKYKDIPNIKPIFRLHPPKKGLKGGIKRSFVNKGNLGYRGKEINTLIEKML